MPGQKQMVLPHSCPSVGTDPLAGPPAKGSVPTDEKAWSALKAGPGPRQLFLFLYLFHRLRLLFESQLTISHIDANQVVSLKLAC